MSERLDESLWGPEPSADEVAAAEQGIAKRAEEWNTNPPEKPENHEPHPDSPDFVYPAN